MANVTKHAAKRFKQRLGVHKADVNKNAKRALKEGLTQSDVRGELARLMAGLYFRNKMASNIRLYKGMAYIFAGDTLITVFKIPESFQKEAAEMQRRKEESISAEDGRRRATDQAVS